MFKTDICKMLGIKYPIIQGGMAWIATAELATAVSQAGGLGIIAAGNAPGEVVKKEIKKLKAMTDKPFGVNVFYFSPYVDEVIEVILEEEVPVVTTGAGNPGKHMAALKANNTKVFPLVSSVSLAKRLQKAGADGFIAEGMECGGHVGTITTMALVPQIVDAVDVPVIAAGGIFDARGFVASLALGAQGVQMGTRFVCTKECIVHENYKKTLIKAKDRDTILTGTQGHQARVIKNKLAREFEEKLRQQVSNEELEALGEGKLYVAAIEGDMDRGSIMAGQVAAMIKKEQSVAEIIDEIVGDSENILRKLAGVLNE